MLSLFLSSAYSSKPVIKCLLISWRHYCTGHTTYKRILAAACPLKVCWQILVGGILSFYSTFIDSHMHICALLLALEWVYIVPLAESEGTLILPQVESFHRLQDDDATTVTSDDSFFSAAEVSSFPLLSKNGNHKSLQLPFHTLHSSPAALCTVKQGCELSHLCFVYAALWFHDSRRGISPT